ncbi:hypothetical protein NDU88_005245 [Pleurodeles waltl]|uniref:Uncharacterized protein n=1 Tax=Pleurodeles waltl TaxID=8319 RepID=A0AAV7UKF2_PLEWA|nr:hypothetical protein NDU88_005245 [Pleurodeles waltl]
MGGPEPQLPAGHEAGVLRPAIVRTRWHIKESFGPCCVGRLILGLGGVLNHNYQQAMWRESRSQQPYMLGGAKGVIWALLHKKLDLGDSLGGLIYNYCVAGGPLPATVYAQKCIKESFVPALWNG